MRTKIKITKIDIKRLFSINKFSSIGQSIREISNSWGKKRKIYSSHIYIVIISIHYIVIDYLFNLK